MEVTSHESEAVFKERRAGSHDLVEKLTQQRTEMLALYCRVAGLAPFDDGDVTQVQKLLQQFCQVLVDYVATGHFSLYERIVNGQERRKEVADLAEKLYPDIAATTEMALDFNDKYDCEDHCEIQRNFDQDLSELGEALAGRIELEDQLIKTLM